MKYLGIIALLVLILTAGIWWKSYKYGDCRKVGHSVLYCVMDINR